MNLLAKHEIRHVASFCNGVEYYNCCQHVGELSIKFNFDKRKAAIIQMRPHNIDFAVEPTKRMKHKETMSTLIWSYSLDEAFCETRG
jgi:hypothetical protein